jgi:hypothetical protein
VSAQAYFATRRFESGVPIWLKAVAAERRGHKEEPYSNPDTWPGCRRNSSVASRSERRRADLPRIERDAGDVDVVAGDLLPRIGDHWPYTSGPAC